MRIKFALVVFALLVVVVPLGLVAAQPTNPTAPSGNRQAAATCADKDFLTGIGKDYTELGEKLAKVDAKKATDVVGAALILAGVRQKYEDLEKVPEECFATQVMLVVLTANLGDLYTLQLANLAAPDSAKEIEAAVKAQTERVEKLQKTFKESLGLKAE
jgi:hypothetical protein